MRIIFRFRTIPLLATLIAVVLGVALGQWQTRRAQQKDAIEASFASREAAPPLELGAAVVAADEAEYRRIVVRGEFRADWPVYLDNRPYHGVAGFYLLMPLQIEGSQRHVLVARGWIPRDPAERTRLPAIATPAGTLRIEGIGRRNPGRSLALGQEEALRPAAIVQNADLAGFAAASGLALQPFLLEQTSDSGDGLVRDWPRPSSGAQTHRGYAFQWYALAATVLIFFIATGFRNGKK